MDTDRNAEKFVNLGRVAVEQVGGELLFSPGFGTVAPVVVLTLPDGQAPDTVLPGITWVEYTGA